jgi:hypothetical protein
MSYTAICNDTANPPFQQQMGAAGVESVWQHTAQDISICLGLSDSFALPIMSKATYPALDKSLREELVAIYFEQVHPLCPIIDEQNFWWHYFVLTEEDFFDMFPAILFNAMMFAAFGVSFPIYLSHMLQKLIFQSMQQKNRFIVLGSYLFVMYN